MRIFITGGSGQLGSDLVTFLIGKGDVVRYPTREEMDITNGAEVDKEIIDCHPDCVIHCAAWTNVDLAENEKDRCRAINVEGTRNVLNCCILLDIPIVYISTDYVFSGKGTKAWKTGDETDPQNVYGVSKRDGEDIVRKHPKHFILRTSWLYGANGDNFVKTIIRLSKIKKELNVVCDQIGSPTYSKDLSELIGEIILTERYGTYHVCNEGYCSRYEFAKKIVEMIGADTKVVPTTSDSIQSKARRPANSRMDTSELIKNGFRQMPLWEDALGRFINQLRI